MTRLEALEIVAIEARKLTDAVQLDDTGMMVGTIWQGGSGGLLSKDTIRQADRVRLALDALRQAEEPA